MGLFSNFGGMSPGQVSTLALGEEGGGAAGGLFNPGGSFLPPVGGGLGNITFAVGESGSGGAGLFNPGGFLPPTGGGLGNITFAVGESGGGAGLFNFGGNPFSMFNPNPFSSLSFMGGSLFPFSSSFPLSGLNTLGLNSMLLGGGNMTMALGESGGGLAGVSLPGIGNSTFAIGEEGGGINSQGFGNTTLAIGEEGGYGGVNLPTLPGNMTMALGESGGGLSGLLG